jgi:hypothetical protein
MLLLYCFLYLTGSVGYLHFVKYLND